MDGALVVHVTMALHCMSCERDWWAAQRVVLCDSCGAADVREVGHIESAKPWRPHELRNRKRARRERVHA